MHTHPHPPARHLKAEVFCQLRIYSYGYSAPLFDRCKAFKDAMSSWDGIKDQRQPCTETTRVQFCSGRGGRRSVQSCAITWPLISTQKKKKKGFLFTAERFFYHDCKQKKIVQFRDFTGANTNCGFHAPPPPPPRRISSLLFPPLSSSVHL